MVICQVYTRYILGIYLVYICHACDRDRVGSFSKFPSCKISWSALYHTRRRLQATGHPSPRSKRQWRQPLVLDEGGRPNMRKAARHHQPHCRPAWRGGCYFYQAECLPQAIDDSIKLVVCLPSWLCHIPVIDLSYSCHKSAIFLPCSCHIHVILLSYPCHIFVIFQ